MGIFERVQCIDGPELRARMPMADAVRALQDAVRSGFDPETDPPRTIVDVAAGQLLLMPASLGHVAGQKLATVAPGNPARGLERIQALYVVLDGETLAPLAIVDGTELTSLRTPAMSAALADGVAAPDARELVVFGTGPQAIRHVEAMRTIRPIERAVIVGRDAGRAAAAARAAAAFDVEAVVGSVDDVAGADIVVCATSARAPLFDAALVADAATVVAMGSHEADARELPGALLARSTVIVESRGVAATEAGDVLLAITEGHLSSEDLVLAKDVLTGAALMPGDRPRVIKTCGQGWQDLAVAARAVR